MLTLSKDYIKNQISDSFLIFHRGEDLYHYGSFFLSHGNSRENKFIYEVDGNYGDYKTQIDLNDDHLLFSCTCPYPGDGCKHVVAALFDIMENQMESQESEEISMEDETAYFSKDEIKEQALSDRNKRAELEKFTIIRGEMIKGYHKVINQNHKEYQLCIHDPNIGTGHCSCPDYLTNGLGTCKHLRTICSSLKEEPDFNSKKGREIFPFVDIYWNSALKAPAMFSERLEADFSDLITVLESCFNNSGEFTASDLSQIVPLINKVDSDKRVRIQENLITRVDRHIHNQQLEKLSGRDITDYPLKATLYPYQREGVAFGLFKTGVLIGDEMGLGKTLQAIALGILKKEIFDFSKILIVTLASLKEQWKREIEKFSDEKAVIIEGSPGNRKILYQKSTELFKITNYEAVLRDVTILSRFNPDIIVLDEAQRIKNFSTKTADAVKQIPKRHAIVLTGTPMENKLEDIYSIVQFLDPFLLTPLWEFAGDHFLIPRKKKSSIAGYQNLDKLKEKLKDLVIRRKKEDVLKDLPDEVVNNYYIDLTVEQMEIHAGYARSLLPLINKKYLTPMDIRKIQIFLLRMRMVCDSSYLIDRETHFSPKLKELESIVDELVIQNKHKIVIFSEWTTMIFLIAKSLSKMKIPFIELSGKVPVKKRQALIDEFTNNPECRIFLSTDAGGTGLNLQAADCVINFELPWNPAKMNQRIGRISRIGQESSCINVINLIAKKSIEERILTGIQLKTEVFKGVFDDGPDSVEFSAEKRNEMLNRLREMMGEEGELSPIESAEPEEIPEDTPYYLNPEVLGDEKEDEKTEEKISNTSIENPEPNAENSESVTDNILASQPPEKIETVLNSGMEFIGGLMEMATGKKMSKSDDQEKMIEIDRTTGEITMKFKLPGF